MVRDAQQIGGEGGCRGNVHMDLSMEDVRVAGSYISGRDSGGKTCRRLT